MSSSLTVVHGARRFKVPVTPSTLLGQVRDEVCAGPGGLGFDCAQYGLARQGKALDLTVPVRFAGLVNNASVDLVRLNTDARAPLRVKVRVPHGADFVGSFAGSATVADVAAAAGVAGAPLTLGAGTPADPQRELRSLGAGAGGLLFTAQPSRTAPPPPRQASASVPASASAPAPTKKPSALSGASQPLAKKDEHSHAAASSDPPARNAVVVTDHTGIDAAAADAGDPPEMGVSQFRTYYSHLKAQAEPAMISKETRERMRNEKRRQVEASVIRIRLPDQTFLEGKFQNGEHGEQVYSFVRSYLRRPSQPFALRNTNPAFVLEPKHHLLDDCHFGSRALLLFEWLSAPKTSEPILNDAALALARPVKPESEQKDGSSGSASSAAMAASQRPTPSDEAPETRKRDALKKAVPKWMRLHKS